MNWIGEEIRAYGRTFRKEWRGVMVGIALVGAFMVLAPIATSAPASEQVRRPAVYKAVVDSASGTTRGNRATFTFNVSLKLVSGRGSGRACRLTRVHAVISKNGDPLNGIDKTVQVCTGNPYRFNGYLTYPPDRRATHLTVYIVLGNSVVARLGRR